MDQRDKVLCILMTKVNCTYTQHMMVHIPRITCSECMAEYFYEAIKTVAVEWTFSQRQPAIVTFTLCGNLE